MPYLSQMWRVFPQGSWGIVVCDFITCCVSVYLLGHVCVLGQLRFSHCVNITAVPSETLGARVFPDPFSAQNSQCHSSA